MGAGILFGLILALRSGDGFFSGGMLLAFFFLVPNLLFFFGSRLLKGAWLWMPGVMLLMLQSWIIIDLERFPGSTSPLILVAGPVYLIVLLSLYLGLTWLFLRRLRKAGPETHS